MKSKTSNIIALVAGLIVISLIISAYAFNRKKKSPGMPTRNPFTPTSGGTSVPSITVFNQPPAVVTYAAVAPTPTATAVISGAAITQTNVNSNSLNTQSTAMGPVVP